MFGINGERRILQLTLIFPAQILPDLNSMKSILKALGDWEGEGEYEGTGEYVGVGEKDGVGDGDVFGKIDG